MANVGNLVDRDSQYIASLWACSGKFASTGVFMFCLNIKNICLQNSQIHC